MNISNQYGIQAYIRRVSDLQQVYVPHVYFMKWGYLFKA